MFKTLFFEMGWTNKKLLSFGTVNHHHGECCVTTVYE